MTIGSASQDLVFLKELGIFNSGAEAVMWDIKFTRLYRAKSAIMAKEMLNEDTSRK